MSEKVKTLRIEPLSEEHIDYVMSWVNDPEITFYFASMKKEITKEEELQFLKSLIASKDDEVYSVFDEGEYVGQVSINKIDWMGEVGRIFLVIAKEKQGNGYAKLILKSIQDKAFNEIGLNKLYLIVRPDNAKGIHIYKQCGFDTEGVLRQEYKVNDQRFDMKRMSILKEDWQTWWK